MKLNLFTPLPPARTDIAQSVARMLPALASRAEVTLWTDQEKFDPKLKHYARVRTYTPDSIHWPDLSFADFNLYNVGNDARFHANIVDVALRMPGIVILHDVCVNELAYHSIARGASLRERYLELMAMDGEDSLRDGEACLDGKMGLREVAALHPLTWWPLQRACGVISHNAEALYDALPDLKLPVLDVPLPWQPRESIAAPLRRSRGKGRLEMVICGYLNSPSRRLQEILSALSAFPRRDEMLLHVAGHVEGAEQLKTKIGELGLSRSVRLHGFLSEKALAKLMERSHLAVNLRWPSVGEASGAQTRFWNHSLPTLVTRTGWYARQPEESVLFVDPYAEAADLHRHWTTALDDYDSVANVGLRGREVLVERHSAEVFAAALMEFLPVAAEHRKTVFVPELARRAGRAIGGIGLGAAVAASLSEHVAETIAGIAGTVKNMR